MVWAIRTFTHFDKKNDQACGPIIFSCHDIQPKVFLFLSLLPYLGQKSTCKGRQVKLLAAQIHLKAAPLVVCCLCDKSLNLKDFDCHRVLDFSHRKTELKAFKAHRSRHPGLHLSI